MAQTPAPRKGCFTSSYPSTEWREVPCTTVPLRPQLPARGFRSAMAGDGTDWTAISRTGISVALGSFDDGTTGVTSESGPIGNMGPPVANAYTLQLNTNYFPRNVSCPDSPNPGCQGWQQFIFENNGSTGSIYIQYWLLRYNTDCPSATGAVPWAPFQFTGSTDIYCVKNSEMTMNVPAQPINSINPNDNNLKHLKLMGQISASGDFLIFFTGGGGMYMIMGDHLVNATTALWQRAEFNVFGDGGNEDGGGKASFNSGATLVVRTALNDGAKLAPICTQDGFTAETNNLFLVGVPAMVSAGVLPAIVFTESNAPGGTPPSCATSAGDTHLMTFDGLFYDFQASGDFLLVQAHGGDFLGSGGFSAGAGGSGAFGGSGGFSAGAGGSGAFGALGNFLQDRDFVVQTRQASGAPMWPNASVNKAVATRMGATRVAVCLAPARLVINSNVDQLYDGESLPLFGGVTVSRTGNVYDIRRQGGDIVRAEVNNGWIDVFVGYAPESKVRGLLGNANGDTTDDIATRIGRVLGQPVSFADLYQRYGESWRVPFYDLLLSVCGNGVVENSIPQKPFYANDLAPAQYSYARNICVTAGVEDPTLLDACTLDVTVLADQTAANVFTALPAPIAVMQAGSSPPPPPP